MSFGNQGTRLTLGCLLLAAGQGRRFGSNKLLAPFHYGGEEKPLISFAMETLKAFRELTASGEKGIRADIFVLTGSPEIAALAEKTGLPCRPCPVGAKSDTIRFGLTPPESDRWDGCLFQTADQPLLTPESLVRLSLAFASDPERPFRLSFQGRQGNPVIFPRSFFPALRCLSGETGGSVLLSGGRREPGLVEASFEAELWDVDTREDLEKLEKIKTYKEGL